MKLAEIAAVMNRFPEVEWDRCTSENYYVNAFGWIARDDGRSDFMLLGFDAGRDGLETDLIFYSTSSAELSEEFARRLGMEDQHVPCQRVEDVFGELVKRKVVLSDG